MARDSDAMTRDSGAMTRGLHVMKAQLSMSLRAPFCLPLIGRHALGPLSKPDCIGSSLLTDTCRFKLTLLLAILDGVRLPSDWVIYTDSGGIGHLKVTTKWLWL
jgi:hypothetical protein